MVGVFILKIRGKLILSFSVVMVILLSTLGSITYFTFKDTISQNREQISRLTLKNHYLSFNIIFEKLRRQTYDLTSAIAQQNSVILDNLTEFLHSQEGYSQYISSVVALDVQSNTLYGETSSNTEALLNYLSSSVVSPKNQGLHSFFAVDSSVWVNTAVKLEGDEALQLFYLLDMNSIWNSIISQNTRSPNTLFFVAGANGILRSHVEPPEKGKLGQLSHVDLLLENRLELANIIDKVANKNDRFFQIGKNNVITSELNVLDWRLYSVIATKDYMADLIKLKNRVIAATLVTLWFSVWIVLIIAHRIAKPIPYVST